MSAIAVAIALATLGFLAAYSGLKDVLWQEGTAGSTGGGHGLGMEQVPAVHAAGMVLVSLVSLIAGASLGPEAAVLAIALAVGTMLTDRIKRPELERVLGMSGVGSLLAGLFGSPLTPSGPHPRDG